MVHVIYLFFLRQIELRIFENETFFINLFNFVPELDLSTLLFRNQRPFLLFNFGKL